MEERRHRPHGGGAAELTQWEHRALDLVRRRGIRGFVLSATLFSIAGSLLITTVFLAILDGFSDPSFWATAYPMTVAIPAVVAPSVTFVMAKLISRLDDVSTTLQVQAVTDALTGVGNRRGFFEHIAKTPIESPSRIAMLDMDDFKRLNDTHGHALGDQALRMVADWMVGVAGNAGYVARFGGDEFVALLGDDRAGAAGPTVSFDVDGNVFSASIGTAPIHPGDEIDDVLAIADAELYRIKPSASRVRVRDRVAAR